MEDFFYLCFGLAVCSAPFVGLAFLIALLRRPEDRDARARLDAVEAQLGWVRSEGTKLGERIVALEAREKELEAKLAAAIASGAAGVVRESDAVAEAHAAPRRDERAEADAEPAAVEPVTSDAAAIGTANAAIETPNAVIETPNAAIETPNAAIETPNAVIDAAPTEQAASERATSEAPSAEALRAASESAAEEEERSERAAAPARSGSPPVPPTAASPSGAAPAAAPLDEGWERWIGVRGAAALGASVLVIAALYFFQYSIEHGWIGPFARVLIGLATGTACVVGSEPLRRRYGDASSGGIPIAATLANWLAGAGIAILYASAWAASGLYHLVPTLVSGVAMVAITGACAGLSVFRDSLAIAVLGLFGGFLTPIALSTGEDRPISLFTYLFLLDAALLFLAQRKRWPALAALALAFTALYQLSWIFGRMDEATSGVGLVVTLAFSVLFAAATLLASRGEDDEARESATNRMVRVAAVLVPFALAIAFAMNRGAVAGFGATLTLVIVLSLGAALVGLRDRLGWLTPAAASASAGLVLVFVVSHHGEASIAWQASVLALAPALLFVALHELAARELAIGPFSMGEARAPLAIAALVASIAGSLTIGAFAVTHGEHFVVWSLAIVSLGLVASRAAHVARWPLVHVLLSLLHGGTWSIWLLVWADRDDTIPLALVPLIATLHLALHQGLALLGHRASDDEADASGRALLETAAALGPAMLLFTLPAAFALRDLLHPLYAALTLVLGLFVAWPALRGASRQSPGLGIFAPIAAGLVAFVVTAHELSPLPLRATEHLREARLVTSALGCLLFTVLPVLSSRLSRTRWAWRAAAITPMLFFLALHHGWTAVLGPRFIGALPVALALATLSLVGLARARNDDDGDVRTSAIVWLAGATMAFVTVAIPLQLDREWITIGWALEGAALLALYRRLDHAGLKWVATALFLVVSTRLLLNPYVLGYYERSPIRILNWLSYTYLVPAAALVAAGALLRDVEGPRLRGWERASLPDGVTRPCASLFFALALAIGFAWVNLTIFDWFATGPRLTIPTDRLPARDLALSIAWALYGLFVLALGMWRESTAMRITSLLLVLLTAAKVFLYDLSNLRDLYRVAALVGLAMSLILISLAYQRFVFRSTPKEKA